MTLSKLLKLTKQPHTLARMQWWGFLLGWLLISVATLTPLEHMPTAPGSDKLHHVIGFAGWASLCAFGSLQRFHQLCIGIFLWGGAIELIQPFVNRYGEWADLAANTTGIVLVIILVHLVKRKYKHLTLFSD